MNTDANLSEANSWGLSALCRDGDGEVIAAATWKMKGHRSIERTLLMKTFVK